VISVAVVGGGVLGMTLAKRLREQGHDVTLIEGARAPGGLASPQRIGAYTWDRFYHVILLSDRHLLELLDELGFGHRLHWGVTRTGFFTDGRLYSLSSSLDFLRFPPLSLLDKARLAFTILYASRLRDATSLERVSVSDWLRRLSGDHTFRRIWLPLLKSKLGDNYRLASASFIWAIIARMYAARRSGLKREMFGHVDGGYDPVLKAFAAHLEEMGVELQCGQPVARVEDAREGGAHVTLVDGSWMYFDKVVLTVPCGRIPALVPQLSPAETARMRNVVYQGVVCASLLLKRPLADYYVTNITDDGIPFTGVIEMTALVDRERFGGNALVYLPRYCTQDDPFWRRTDEEIRADFLAALRRMYPSFDESDVLAFCVARVRDVLAVATLDYTARTMPPVRTSLCNVFVVNSAQIANGTLNLNETIALANEKAGELASHLRGSDVPIHA